MKPIRDWTWFSGVVHITAGFALVAAAIGSVQVLGLLTACTICLFLIDNLPTED